ncbi:UNVERIFIED_CONTAM: hypothetical protein Sradi_2034500 [Sesamum radiatum]|uniref:Uncharacterized protein n=1 Tax=Sesamum radiatum TaxID=300843 RepID=A0AAW2TGT3_SESRA
MEALMTAAGGAVERSLFAGRDELVATVHRILDVMIMDLLTLCVDNVSLVLDRGYHLPMEIAVAAADLTVGRRNPSFQELLATVSLPA